MKVQSVPGSCKQCTENPNLYITCECSRQLPPTHGPLTSEGDQKVKESVQSKVNTDHNPYRAAKAVIFDIVRIYESTPPRTMKYLALISSLILFFAVLSLVLAQRDEAAQSKYGMAFPIDEQASNKAEKRVAASLTIASAGVPGESGSLSRDDKSSDAETTTATPTTTMPSEETKSTDGPSLTEEESKGEGSDLASVLANSAVNGMGDDDDKGENGDRNPRIVFIERLMGLHLSGPMRPPFGSDGPTSDSDKADSSAEASSVGSNSKNPLDKVNAKWASRMRKFTIPIPSSGDSQPPSPLVEQPNPMLRYAAAAMMSRLIAAAARAQMEAQAREAMSNQILSRGGKDKDEESDDETVPVIVATMRDERGPQGPQSQIRPMPPMYGRPMPRGPIVRPPVLPFTHHHQHPLASAARSMPSLQSVPQRAYVAPPQQQQSGPINQRGPIGPIAIQRRGASPNPAVQPVLVMLALPVNSAEGRSASSPGQIAVHPMASGSGPAIQFASMHSGPQPRSHAGPFYPTVPYSVPYVRPAYQPAPQAAYAVPVHVPVPVQYQPAPAYHHTQRPVYHYPIQRQMAAYSHVRPVIEVPVEVPYHVPVQVPVTLRGGHSGPAGLAYPAIHPLSGADSEQSSSDQDHIVLLYDAEIHHGAEGGDDVEGSQSDIDQTKSSAGQTFIINRPGPPQPPMINPNKLKLWRELIAAKQATQSGVRFIPISVAGSGEESQGPPSPSQQTGPQSHAAPHYHPQSGPSSNREQAAESVHQPAFIVLADQDEH